MSEVKQKIPARLESAVKGGYVAGAKDIVDDALGKAQNVVNEEHEEAISDLQENVGTGGSVDERIAAEKDRAEAAENALASAIGGLNAQNYVTVTATDQTTDVTDVLPTQGVVNTVYRVGNWNGSQFDETTYSEYSWSNGAYVHISTKTQTGEVFDISAYHATGGTLATYANLAAALDENNGGGVPASLRKGGMSVKFVLSSDNKYVQYRLMADSFTTDVSQWQGTTNEIEAGSNDLVESGAISEELNGKKINQPTTAQEKQINSSGVWSTNSGYYSTIVDIEDFVGEEITSTDECVQYAFLSAVGDTDVTFCSGCARENGYPVSETIPADCKYLYIYLAQNNTDFPTLTATGETNGIKGQITEINGRINNLDSTNGIVFAKNTTFGDSDLNKVNNIKKCIKSVVLLDSSLVGKKLVLRAFGINDINHNFQFIVCDTTDISDDTVPPSSGDGVVDSIVITDTVWDTYKGIVRLVGDSTKIEIAVDFDYLKDTQPWLGATATYNNAGIKNFIIDYKNTIDKSAEEINAQIAPLNSIKKYISFNGTSTTAVLTNPIVLENNGDSLELDLIVRNTGGSLSQNGSYAFSLGGSSSEIAIGINKTRMCIRADDGTWIVPTNSTLLPVDTEHQAIRIEYADDKINTYRNDVLVNSFSGLKKVTILGFGHGNDDYGYWDGAINNDIKVNGEIVNLIDNCTAYKVSIIYPNGFLTNSQVVKIESSPLYIEKEQDVLHVYKYVPSLNKYIDYPMHHYNASYTAGAYPSFYDIWRLEYVALCSFDGDKMNTESVLFKKGEAELAIRVPKANNESEFEYVGGSVHGFENIYVGNNIRNIQILIDNQTIGETDSLGLRKANCVDIYQKTELCQSYSNSNPFANALKHWHWSENDNFSVSTEVQILRDIDIKNAQLGMMCTFRHSGGVASNAYLTSRAIKDNNPFNVYNIEDDWTSQTATIVLRAADPDCKKITTYGELGLGFSMRTSSNTIKQSGGMFMHTNGSNYNKIYFALVNYGPNDVSAYSAAANEKLDGVQEWIIQ